MDVGGLHPSPAHPTPVGRSTFLGHGALERLSFVLAALAGLWLAIGAVLGWLG
jgi:hypothetical protein